MNYLSSIASNNDRISKEYRTENSIDQIKLDLSQLDWTTVTNSNLLNLRSILFPTTKRIVSIASAGKKITGDLEIADDSHSYMVNGIPTHNTVNLPSDYPFADFQGIYIDAYQTGFIKGLTTYRSGSMTSVLSAAEQKNDNDIEEEVILSDIRLPDSSKAEVKILHDHEGGSSRKWYCTISLNENNAPVALFVQTNAIEKSVTTNDAVERLIALARAKGIPEQYIESTSHKFQSDSNSTKIARAIGLLLRHGVRIKNIVSTLDKVEGVTFASFVFHIKKLLGSYIRDGEKIEGETCNECNGTLIYESGCHKCSQCGNSKCS